MRRALIPVVLAALLCALAAAPPAIALRASFSASITGTYTERGSLTDTGCYHVGADDQVIPFTGSGASSEDTVFASRRPTTFVADRNPARRDFLAGTRSTMQVAFTIRRASTLADGGAGFASYCTPQDPPHPPPDCGRRTRTLDIRLLGRQKGMYGGPAFIVYDFSRGVLTPYHPPDPFASCPLLQGDLWLGLLDSGRAPVSVARVFRHGARTIVVHGAKSGGVHRTEPDGQGQWTRNGSYRLGWTLTLRRRG